MKNIIQRLQEIICFILIMHILNLPAAAQSGGIDYLKTSRELNKLISIHLENVSIEKALEIIAAKADIEINYNSSRIRNGKKISIKMENVSAVQSLAAVLSKTNSGLKITSGGQLAVIPVSKSQGRITGSVSERESGKPLAGVNVYIPGRNIGAAANKEGRFSIANLATGIYSLETSMAGYAPRQLNNIIVTEDAAVNVDLKLDEAVYSISEIIVTPGHFSLMEKKPLSSKALKADDIRSFPQIGEDIYRAINRLPGVTGHDVSAKFNVRGGEYDEVLVMLDGMELYDPFHLKDLDGFLSIIDVEAVKSIDMMTGAFPAEYGNRLSGVFNMKSDTPVLEKPKTSLAVSFLNARLLSKGSFDEGSGQWLFIARRGYLDLLLKYLNPEDNFLPVYYDVLGKVQYFISPDHSISVNMLFSDDEMKMTETDDNVDFNTNYSNNYGWLTWNAQLNPEIFSRTILSTGFVDQEGFIDETPGRESDFKGRAEDARSFRFYGLKQDWTYEINKRLFLKWGFSAKKFDADYNFFFSKRETADYINGQKIYEFDTTAVKADPDGNEFASYLSGRFRLLKPLTAELGMRYDYTSWSDDKNLSPRINMVYDISKRTVLRAGWGHFYQTQGIHQLNAADGETEYYPAELSEHRMLGFEHEFLNGINLRAEIYQKKLTQIQPRWQNFRGFTLNPFAEIHPDRFKVEPKNGESSGFEIYLKKDKPGKFNWWASYSYSIAEEDIDGLTIPRDFDQRHTVYLDFTYKPNSKWRFNASWQYHSGWPYTESQLSNVRVYEDSHVEYDWTAGPLNARRLPAYHRLDVRAARIFKTSRARVSTFLEIRNLYNRKNIREYIYEYGGVQNGSHSAVRTGAESQLPLLPSFGISWEF